MTKKQRKKKKQKPSPQQMENQIRKLQAYSMAEHIWNVNRGQVIHTVKKAVGAVNAQLFVQSLERILGKVTSADQAVCAQGADEYIALMMPLLEATFIQGVLGLVSVSSDMKSAMEKGASADATN